MTFTRGYLNKNKCRCNLKHRKKEQSKYISFFLRPKPFLYHGHNSFLANPALAHNNRKAKTFLSLLLVATYTPSRDGCLTCTNITYNYVSHSFVETYTLPQATPVGKWALQQSCQDKHLWPRHCKPLHIPMHGKAEVAKLSLHTTQWELESVAHIAKRRLLFFCLRNTAMFSNLYSSHHTC